MSERREPHRGDGVVTSLLSTYSLQLNQPSATIAPSPKNNKNHQPPSHLQFPTPIAECVHESLGEDFGSCLDGEQHYTPGGVRMRTGHGFAVSGNRAGRGDPGKLGRRGRKRPGGQSSNNKTKTSDNKTKRLKRPGGQSSNKKTERSNNKTKRPHRKERCMEA